MRRPSSTSAQRRRRSPATGSTSRRPGRRASRPIPARQGHIFTHRGSSTRWYLREHGLLDRFSLLVTSEDGLPRKPAPDGILRILQRSGAPRVAFAMVGDREIDVLAAHNAGILACRFAPEEPDVSTEAEIVLTDLRDILKAIKEERTK